MIPKHVDRAPHTYSSKEMVPYLYDVSNYTVAEDQKDYTPSFAGIAIVGGFFVIMGTSLVITTNFPLGAGLAFMGALFIAGAWFGYKWYEYGDLASEPDSEAYSDSRTFEPVMSPWAKEEARKKEVEEIVKTVKSIIKVRCRYCGTLNEENANKCEKCGGPL
jgi:ribosomal protein L40E